MKLLSLDMTFDSGCTRYNLGPGQGSANERRPSRSDSDVTPGLSPTATPPDSPTASDDEYDILQSLRENSDFRDEGVIVDSIHLPRGQMAADFSEGRLETIVGKPQKELAGTKDAYVSFLVTTKVGSFKQAQHSFIQSFDLLTLHSPTSNPSTVPNSPSAAALQTSSSYGNS